MIFCNKVLVLPEPAPAKTKSRLLSLTTASCCLSFKPSNRLLLSNIKFIFYQNQQDFHPMLWFPILIIRFHRCYFPTIFQLLLSIQIVFYFSHWVDDSFLPFFHLPSLMLFYCLSK